jgi:hypothetical protein
MLSNSTGTVAAGVLKLTVIAAIVMIVPGVLLTSMGREARGVSLPSRSDQVQNPNRAAPQHSPAAQLCVRSASCPIKQRFWFRSAWASCIT